MRALGWTLLLAAVVCGSTGCGSQSARKGIARGGSASTAARWREGTARETASSKSHEGTAPAVREPAPRAVEAKTSRKDSTPARKDSPPPRPAAPEGPRAGQLTAGSFDDARHPKMFPLFLHLLGQTGGVEAELLNRFRGRRVTLTVRDAQGRPVGDARVSVRAGNAGVELRTRTDGRAIVVTPWDGLPDDAEWAVTVTPPDGGKEVTARCRPGADRLDVTLPDTQAAAPKILDLAMVIDTTGSMGDELEYIKSEMKWIATTVHDRYPNVRQRFALIVYRDEGDEYVTRTFPFTESLDQLLANLRAQSATGGGDEPEAVQKAMAEAAQLTWTAGPAARVLVHLADAPPHDPDFLHSLKAVDQVRKAGVSFYPVACSGYSPACEFHMRVSALLTGGQFLFLTDDSGIGNAHAEPNIPFFHVERLNRLLVRMIAAEIEGRRLEPRPGEIIRSVGNPPRAEN